jgi:hypothetical protein
MMDFGIRIADCGLSKAKSQSYKAPNSNTNGFVKTPRIVMPDLIRHTEPIEFTGFRLSPE